MRRKYVSKETLQQIQTGCSAVIEFEENLVKSPLLFKQGDFLAFMTMLKDKYDFVMLSNISAVDYPEYFEVVYHLTATEAYKEVIIKVQLEKDKAQLPSVTGIWPTADFQEREQFDLMGIIFTGHPNLKRILLTDDFVGHPLRKDFKM